MDPVHITYFFRRSRPGAYSIEKLYHTIQKEFPAEVTYKNHYLSRCSTGIFNRILLCLESRRLQKGINHVTGDINFITLLLNRNKTVLTIHDVDSLRRKNKISNFLLELIWLKLPAARVKSITVVSQETKKKLLQRVSVSPDKVVVIPNIISDKFKYVPKIFSKEKPVILQVGTKPNKNLESAIQALHSIPCKFIVVGKLSDRQSEMLKKYEIDYENYIGITEEELLKVYTETDILLFISLFEGFGMPILEAQATGRAVITSNCSAMPEVAGKGALLVDPLDMPQITQAVRTLIENDWLREKIVSEGLKNCRRFQNNIIAQQYIALYKSL